jgi:hypothetical protein
MPERAEDIIDSVLKALVVKKSRRVFCPSFTLGMNITYPAPPMAHPKRTEALSEVRAVEAKDSC